MFALGVGIIVWIWDQWDRFLCGKIGCDPDWVLAEAMGCSRPVCSRCGRTC